MKRLIKLLFRYFGYEIHQYTPSFSSRARREKFFKTFDIDIVLDIGANEGQYASLIRKLGYMNRIISFEPLPDAYEELKSKSKNDELWDCYDRVALGSENKESIEINISENSVSSSILPMKEKHKETARHSDYQTSTRVPMRTLSGCIEDLDLELGQKVLVKLDVQGFEKEILKGASEKLSEFDFIQMELSLTELYEGGPLTDEMLTCLTKKGFQPWALIPGFTDDSTGEMLQVDGIFKQVQGS